MSDRRKDLEQFTRQVLQALNAQHVKPNHQEGVWEINVVTGVKTPALVASLLYDPENEAWSLNEVEEIDDPSAEEAESQETHPVRDLRE